MKWYQEFELQLIKVNEVEVPTGLKTVVWGMSSREFWTVHNGSDELYIKIDGLYHDGRYYWTDCGGGEWYRLWMGYMGYTETEQKIYELIQSGLEPYQAFEVVAL